MVDLNKLLSEILDFHGLAIENKKIKIISSVNSQLTVNSNYNGLFLVVTNIIDNAIKYCNGNTITIEAKENREMVDIKISNTIDKQNRTSIINEFRTIQAINWDGEMPELDKKLGLKIISFICNKTSITPSYFVSEDTNLLTVCLSISKN